MEIKKPKRGRPRKRKDSAKGRMVYISNEAYAFYKHIGNGNFSEGVDKVFKQYIVTKD